MIQALPVASSHADAAHSPTPDGALVARWEGYVTRVAASFTCSGALDADDLAQEARVRLLLLGRRGVERPPEYIKSLIFNAMKTAVTREKGVIGSGSPHVDELDDDALPHDREPPPEPNEPIHRWTRLLPDRPRRLYELVYERGMSQRAAAKALRVSQPRVAQLHRALLEKARTEVVRDV